MPREIFTYSGDHGRRDDRPSPRVCFSCGRAIRDWESGYEATGLCEDCQVEAEEQARRDNAALDDPFA